MPHMQVRRITMCKKIIAVAFLALSTYLVTIVCESVEFSKGWHNQEIITTFHDVTIAACKKECESRKLCKSAVYYRRSLYCILSQKSTKVVLPTSYPGAVLLSRDQPSIEDDANTCDGNTCSHIETCSAMDAGSRVCKITECRRLPSFYENVLGNMYAVGNRIIAKGRPSDMRVTCGADGQWIPDASHTVIDCSDMFVPSGVYVNFLQHDIYCDMETAEGHWLMFQRRQDGSVNFRRNWVDYQVGFGELTGEFWLGLDTMFEILSNGEYELRVDLEDFDGVKKYAEYSTFSISSASDNYRLTATGYTGDAGDSLSYHSGMQFSTIDMDNDPHAGSCAVNYDGAWWYQTCHLSNLNGQYYPNGGIVPSSPKYVHWHAFHGYEFSLKTTEMKLRRKWNT